MGTNWSIAAGRQLKKRSVTFAPLGAAADEAGALADALAADGVDSAVVAATWLVAAGVLTAALVVTAPVVVTALVVGAALAGDDDAVVVAVALTAPPQAANAARATVPTLP